MPPLSREVANNIDTMKLMGIKWVISADEEIHSPHLEYRGKCYSEEGPMGRQSRQPEGGFMNIYELTNPLGIAFLTPKYEKKSVQESIRTIFYKNRFPWNEGIVFLENDPMTISSGGKLIINHEPQAKITGETYTTKEVAVSSPGPAYLVVSELFRPWWKASLHDLELPIYRAYGGFMAVPVPPGNHTISFKYYPADVYIGFLLTLIAFLLPFAIIKRKIPVEEHEEY